MKRILLFLFVVMLLGCAPDNSNQAGDVEPPTPSPPPTGTSILHVSWMPPTTNTDGSVLTDLDGYNIYYGTSSGLYDQVVSVLNEGLTEYIIEPVPSGFDYYVVMTAFNESGQESAYSEEATTTKP